MYGGVLFPFETWACIHQSVIENLLLQLSIMRWVYISIFQPWNGIDYWKRHFQHHQYHWCWWPVDTRGQDMSSQCIDQVIPEYSRFSTRRLNSLAPGRFQRHFRKVIFQLFFMIDGWRSSCKIVLKWMPMDLTDGKSTLVQVMAFNRFFY